jgi:predicted ATP-grasp superfamily ATP-dependent carboligase
LPPFADIPRTGEVIEAGSPICTLFARGDEAALRCAAESLMRVLG